MISHNTRQFAEDSDIMEADLGVCRIADLTIFCAKLRYCRILKRCGMQHLVIRAHSNPLRLKDRVKFQTLKLD